jgi:hypothetical protein
MGWKNLASAASTAAMACLASSAPRPVARSLLARVSAASVSRRIRPLASSLRNTWKQVPSPNPGTARNGLSGVAVTSATNAWAVGSYSNGSTYRTLIVHWNGKTWKQVPSPNSGSGNNEWSGVAATSAANAWAVGSYFSGTGVSRTLIAHWNGTSWTKVPSPNPGSSGSGLSAVAATSAANAWALGAYSNGTRGNKTLTLHCC